MKKLFLLFSAVALTTSMTFANNNYKINDAAIDEMFASAQEINMTDFSALSSITAPAPDKTKGGFLLRAFLCGGFALHRTYMGTGGKSLWYMYCWNGVGCVDFWWVIIKGDEALNKFKDNGKWIVWLGN